MALYTGIVRPLLFQFDAEAVHDRALDVAERLSRAPRLCRLLRDRQATTSPRLAIEVAGLRFAHPLGLAAGFDKNGRGAPLLGSLGFGHIEIGSVSRDASDGNPRPRLFRLPQERAIVVNYGLPNEGAQRVAARLAESPCPVPLGINVVSTNRGRHAASESDAAVLADYVEAARVLAPHADYLALNLSCPNTPDGRAFFAEGRRLEALLDAIAGLSLGKPVFLKVAPFADTAALDAFVELAGRFALVRGLSVNLPPGKPMPLDAPADVLARMPGAVAGAPCASLADATIAALARRIDPRRHAIIGSGGVFTAADAYRKIRLGASLVQILTALVYEGPAAPARIVRGLEDLLARDGFDSIAEAVGCDVR